MRSPPRIVRNTMLAGAMLFGVAPAHLESSNTSHAARAAGDRTALVSRTSIDAARRFARSRQGVVAFAVLESGGRPRGLRRTVRFGSASVSKAMLLVAYLRRAGRRQLSETERALLRPMIIVSDNNAADAIYRQVGGYGLNAVARASGMRKFSDVGHWANAQITAADQARLFLRIDRLVPAAHRRYARKLLSSIVGPQRWGIPVAARRHRLKAFFKGGWRPGLTHQVALLQRRHGRERIALAILTSGTPSDAYGHETIEGISARVLRNSSKR